MVLKYLVLATLVTLLANSAEGSAVAKLQLNERIFGGKIIPIEQVPWQVSLKYRKNAQLVCGGSIYDKYTIITAAHCLRGFGLKDIRVCAGFSNNNCSHHLPAAAKLQHEGYSGSMHTNDIGIVRLSQPLEFSESIKPIKLAMTSAKHGARALVTGWGALDECAQKFPKLLHGVDVNIVGRKECISSKYSYNEQVVPVDAICAQAVGKDSNSGDSGGPLVSGGVLVGVVSFGTGSGQKYYPGVYADVAVHREWILKAVETLRNGSDN